MVLLKKFLNKSETESLFPRQAGAASTEFAALDNTLSAEAVVHILFKNEDFINQLQRNVTERLLITLCEKYDFEPTDKYLEEISKRKQYISQLDGYLLERRNINNAVENELHIFLQETTANLNKALDIFTESIQNRIKQAEILHGIDNIEKSPFSVVAD